MADQQRREEIRRRIQQLQATLAAMDPAVPAQAEEDATLNSISQKVTDVERRMVNRYASAEKFLLQQMDEQLLGTIMIVGLFILTSFYVFYFLMDNLLRIRRCKCPDMTYEDLQLILKAARYTSLQANRTVMPPATVPDTTGHTLHKTVVVESCPLGATTATL